MKPSMMHYCRSDFQLLENLFFQQNIFHFSAKNFYDIAMFLKFLVKALEMNLNFSNCNLKSSRV